MRKTAIIVDDDNITQDTLRRFFELYHPDFQVVGYSVNEARTSITQIQPDILFLSIENSNDLVWELLDTTTKLDFEIILMINPQESQGKLVKECEVKYLNKPIHLDAFHAIISNVRTNNEKVSDSTRLQSLLGNLSGQPFRNKLALALQEGYEFVHVEDIVRIEAEGNGTKIVQCNGSQLACISNINQLMELLPEDIFSRVHHDHIINTHHVIGYIQGENRKVIMTDHSEVCISTQSNLSMITRFQ